MIHHNRIDVIAIDPRTVKASRIKPGSFALSFTLSEGVVGLPLSGCAASLLRPLR